MTEDGKTLALVAGRDDGELPLPERRGEGRILTIAIAIDDPLLADRVATVLGDAEGVQLVGRGEDADVVLVAARNTTDTNSTTAASEANAARTPLTPREREVLALLAEGASNKTIARRLGISVHTAKFHVASLLDKLDATGRTDAVVHAARLGVIEV